MKRDRIYRVTLEERWKGEGKDGWEPRVVRVLGNGSIEKAIAAAKRNRLADFYEDDKGRKVPVAAVRVISAEVVAEADIEC